MKCQVLMPAIDDLEWDNFLAAQPIGKYTQSSMWGQLKTQFGWEVIRILVQEGDQILGGAQILARHLPVWGKIGYIPKGPVVSHERADVMEMLLDAIEQVAKKNRLLVLSIQPPADEFLYMHPLEVRQFKPSSYYIVPPATVLIDLNQSEDEILRQMRRTTRYDIRLAQHDGMVIREGCEADLPAFYSLMQLTGSRSNYIYYSQAYYQAAWRLFAPRGSMKLWLAYFEDELLASLIIIPFGQWVVATWAASSRVHQEKNPNKLLYWTAIRWGKQQGYRYFDLGGITPIVANALKKNEEPPEGKGKNLALYKLGFGHMYEFPGSYDNYYIIRPKWLVRKAISLALNNKLLNISKLVRGGISRN